MSHENHTAAPLMNFPPELRRFDLRNGFDPAKIHSFAEAGGWGIGGYLENRAGMYTASHFGNRRTLHMGLDIWAKAGEPVFAPLDGTVLYTEWHSRPGDYGGTLVIRHELDGSPIYALYGHLSRESSQKILPGKAVKSGERIARLGREEENGQWPPHLHLQISIRDPGSADMPGVVDPADATEAAILYPNPERLIGPLPGTDFPLLNFRRLSHDE
ncbi:MAG: peptidase M23 [Balneolaceae bacterium]|nr:MAG: peptidase M23 [Balneolaceae bacterium]